MLTNSGILTTPSPHRFGATTRIHETSSTLSDSPPPVGLGFYRNLIRRTCERFRLSEETGPPILIQSDEITAGKISSIIMATGIGSTEARTFRVFLTSGTPYTEISIRPSTTDADFPASEGKAREVRQRYWKRIQDLRISGAEDGISINPASEKDFCSFITSLSPTIRGSLVLTDDGNLRAAWDRGRDRLALEFLGEREAEYVIFKRRPGAPRVSRVSGVDTFNGIKGQIAVFDLKHLVYG